MRKHQLLDRIDQILHMPKNSQLKEAEIRKLIKEEKAASPEAVHKKLLAAYKRLEKEGQGQVEWGLRQKFLEFGFQLLNQNGDSRLLDYVTKKE